MDHFAAITLKQLRALSAVAGSGGVTSGAEALHVTPPAVSTQLRNLEANIGTAVFARGPSGALRPTAQGEELLATARRVENALEACRRRLESLAAGRAGVARLAVVSTAKYFAPKLVAIARRELPGVEIALKIGNREETIAALADGGVDLAIMGRPPAAHLAEARALGPHPHVLIAAPDHPLAAAAEVPGDALIRETFLMRERGSGTRILAERYLDQIGKGAAFDAIEFGTNETIKQGVMAGLGVAFISGHTIVAEIESNRLALVRAPALPVMRQWFLVLPTGIERTKTVELIARFLIERAPQNLPLLPMDQAEQGEKTADGGQEHASAPGKMTHR
jgi:DNA-binding transcriptional LysR family regulator